MDRHIEKVEGFLEAALALQGMTHVVEQFGIAIVDFEARHENGVLVHPVVVSHVGFGGVGQQQSRQKHDRDLFATVKKQTKNKKNNETNNHGKLAR